MSHDIITTTTSIHPRGWASIGELDQGHAPTLGEEVCPICRLLAGGDQEHCGGFEVW